MPPAISELIGRWHEQQRAGQTMSLADLCVDCPEQLPELRRHLEAVKAMESFLGLKAGAQSFQTAQDPYGTLQGSATTIQSADVPRPPGYEILGELGRGGMGVVYKTRHLKLGRIVALKMILAGGHAGQADRARFLAEAEAVAHLQHRNIVSLFEFGEWQGLPYFTLEFVAGGCLASQLNGVPQPPRQVAQLIEQLARGMHYAHTQGIVHRDLKPANVLLGEDGTPKITDFGLARRVEVGTGLTATGAVMGTPSYMAPEQARGETKHAEPAADVYALGAILYECLTGRPPFKAATAVDTILQVLNQEAVSVRHLQPQMNVDLATICHKCLQKEPRKRYASALELAEDCAAFLAGNPIRARPVGRIERTWRWCRRNPTVATLLTMVALTLVAGIVVATGFALRAETARQGEQARAEAEAEAKRDAEQARQQEADARKAAQRQLIDLNAEAGLMAARQGDDSLALLWFARAVELSRDEPDRHELNRIRLTNWLRQVCLPAGAFAISGFRQHEDRFRTFQFSPDGKYLLVLATTEDCLVWDCGRGQKVPLPGTLSKNRAAVWEPKDGLLAVAGKDGRIQLLAPPAFQPVEEVTASGAVCVLSFSRDGQRVAWGGTEGARVWDRSKKEYISPLLAHSSPVTTLSFSASGALLATSARDQKARVFRVPAEGSEPLFPPVAHTRAEHMGAHGGADRSAPRFAADDQIFLTVQWTPQNTQSLVWRSATSGKFLMSSNAPPGGQTSVTAFAVSREGDRVAVLWDEDGQVWDARTRGILATIFTGRSNWCEDVAFAADGKTLVTCGRNLMAQAWSVDHRSNGALTKSFPPIFHPMGVVRASLSPDGAHLATSLPDGTIYLWRVPEGLSPVYSLMAGGVTLPVLSPDGQFVLPGGTTFGNGTQLATRVYRVDTGKAEGPMLPSGGILLNALFSPDGTCVATANSTAQTIAERRQLLFEPEGKGGNVQLWDWRTGKRLAGPIAMPSEPRGLAFHPNGQSLAVVCADYRVVLVDPRTGTISRNLDPGIRTRPLHPIPDLWSGNGEARFSPDGRFLVTWEMAPPVHVWNPNTGDLLFTLPHNDRGVFVAFNPVAPTLLATVGMDSTARVWDLTTGKLLVQLQTPGAMTRVQFSPDGTELIASCGDGRLRAWDWRAGKLKDGLALNPSFSLRDFAFTADCRWLVSLSREAFQVIDWRTKTPASPWWPSPGVSFALDIPAGDRRVIVGGFSGSLRAYDLKVVTTPDGIHAVKGDADRF